MNQETVISAVREYLGEGNADGMDFYEMLDWREDISMMRRAFEARFGFDVPDVCIFEMWSWHSLKRYAGWLSWEDGDVKHFEEFIARFGDRCIHTC